MALFFATLADDEGVRVVTVLGTMIFAATSLTFKIQEKCFHIRKIHIFALRHVHIIDGICAPTDASVAWDQQNNPSGYSLYENMDK